MIAHVYKPDPFGFRDQCDEKLDEGDGKTRMCGYKRSEHESRLVGDRSASAGEAEPRSASDCSEPIAETAAPSRRDAATAGAPREPGTGAAPSRPLVYLACPYTHRERAVRVARFEAANLAAASLMAAGHKVFSPISHTHPIAEAGALPLGWDFWEAYDRAFLAMSGRVVVLRLDGWEQSRGVQGELRIAAEMGIPIEHIDPVVEVSRG